MVPGLEPDRLRALVVTLAAAEASGVARWCLDTAVEYAGVREQFGQKIGAFQSIKHLCAEMLETSESVTAAAWDAARAVTDDARRSTSSRRWWRARSASTAPSQVAKDCIQVLGGIGFTFEHDAHLYLRRAVALRSLVGPSGTYAARLADLAADRRTTPCCRSTWTTPTTAVAPRCARRRSGSPTCRRTTAGPRSPRPAT